MSEIREFTNYDREDWGAGILSWVYQYWNPRKYENTGMATGIELGVQLEGEWTHIGSTCDVRIYGRGEIYRINCGERYQTSFCGQSQRGKQVGFIFYPEETEGFFN